MVGNKAQKAVAAALTGMLALGSVAPAFAGQKLSNGWYRIDGYHTEGDSYAMLAPSGAISGSNSVDVDGTDRYDTMFDAIAFNYELGKYDGLTDLVLVSGTSYADALSASGLAGALHSPIVTTPGDALGIQAERAIKFFAEQNDGELTVWIVGGEAAVNASVEAAVEDIDDVTITVNRIQGADRMATSKAVADTVGYYIEGIENGYVDFGSQIFVANGWAWADALSTSSFAYIGDAPLILTDAEGNLTDEQVDFLVDEIGEGATVNVIGGPAKLAYDTLASLNLKEGALSYIAGEDRYDTSALLVEELANLDFFLDALVGADAFESVAVATGENWPDALIGGAFVGANDGVLVLVGDQAKGGNWDKAVKTAIKNQSGSGYVNAKNKYIIGGEAAVSKATGNLITRL